MKESLLAIPYLYNAFQAFVGKFGLTRAYLFTHYLPYCPGVKVLDLGCGPGTCSHLFNSLDYIGLDLDSNYIDFARRKYPNHSFYLADFASESLPFLKSCSLDLVFAYGLFHHLEDSTAIKFMSNAFKLLKPGGRMISFDGCTYPGQSALARRTTLSDRGKYIRDPQQLEEFASKAGFHSLSTVESSVYAIPYSLLVLSLQKPI